MGMNLTMSNNGQSYPGKGQSGTLPSGGSGNSGPLATAKIKTPRSRDALIRRYVRARLGVTDIRNATPEQIAALRAKNLLPKGPEKNRGTTSLSPRAAAMSRVRSSRTSGGGSD